MAIKLTSTASGGEYTKVMVYGPSGIGKTTLAGTAPNPVIVSSEKKLISLKDKNIPVILIENHIDLANALTFIKTDKRAAKFETVVVDSISDIAETLLSYFKENPVDGNTHPQAAYGHMADHLSPLIKKFRDIADKHVYFIAKAKMVEDQYTNVNMWMPSMPGRVLGPNLPYEFDFVFAMRQAETESGKKYRYLQTQGDIQWLAKGHSSLNTIERPDLSLIFDKLLGKAPQEKKTGQDTKQPPKEEKEKEEKTEAEEQDLRPDTGPGFEIEEDPGTETGFEEASSEG